jgi:hypothetical protein
MQCAPERSHHAGSHLLKLLWLNVATRGRHTIELNDVIGVYIVLLESSCIQ